jgi:hypothetical protein
MRVAFGWGEFGEWIGLWVWKKTWKICRAGRWRVEKGAKTLDKLPTM